MSGRSEMTFLDEPPPSAQADYVDCLIMWSCHSELSRELCTVRPFLSNWLYEVIITSEV